MEQRQPGWYENPNGEPGSVLYWDGSRWGTESYSSDRISNGESSLGKKPRQGTLRMAAIVIGVCKFVQSIGCLFIFAFILLAILCNVFNLGGWKIAGTPLVEWGSRTAMASVFSALAINAILIPVMSLVEKAAFRTVVFDAIDDEECSTKEDIDAVSFLLRAKSTTTRCTIAGSLISAAIGYLAHDPLMSAIGNPGTDILTLAIIIIGGIALAAVFSNLLTNRYRHENPILFHEFMEIDAPMRALINC